MDQIANWMQSNWYELGSLTAQFTFLFAGLWFAGKILKTMRASQQQMGALLRLSMTDGLEERSKTLQLFTRIGDQETRGSFTVLSVMKFQPLFQVFAGESEFEKLIGGKKGGS